MSNLPRITATLLVFVALCLQAFALPKPPRPPVPKPKRPNNSHLLSKAAAAKSHLLSKQNAGKAALLLQASRRARYHPVARRHSANTNAGAKLSLASRAAAAASHQHSLLQQARRAAHNFKTAQHNAGPNSENHQLLLQQQKNTNWFHHAAQARRGREQANNILVGSRRYARLGVDPLDDIVTGNKSDGPDLEEQEINIGNRKDADGLDDFLFNFDYPFWEEW